MRLHIITFDIYCEHVDFIFFCIEQFLALLGTTLTKNVHHVQQFPKMPRSAQNALEEQIWELLGHFGQCWSLLRTFGALLGPKVPKSAQKYQAEPIKTFMLAH